ncbi:MAG: metal ABC transporter ATP-binding protein [Actinomyces sp.]|nr:metal ABC transporter ATP-binding protein [Actinomyces sp.]MCI1642878.1 metal ABC transporter ATP-binding protein [Actinomyces sp.]MCI1662447.1 metal ABC transporter ATP-binding protein [Actinomyces sp.]MCI1692159.1 metal ABC transporter ATP-binding protein [Actinomyces sp.]
MTPLARTLRAAAPPSPDTAAAGAAPACPPPEPPGIEVRDLAVSYREAVALEDVTLRVEPGDLCGLVGMNGAGKSTLFKALMGVVAPSRGEIRFLGVPAERARSRALVGYVPQHDEVDAAFPLSVADVVMTGRYGYQNLLRTPRPADREAVEAALDRVGLADLAHRQIGALSGGQRKRVFVARALAQEARVLLLDEPFAGVDRDSEATIIEVLHDLSDQGVTMLIAEHDLNTLPRICSEAILLNRTVLLHADVQTVLRPENLALAFGIDTARAEEVVR